MKKRPFTRLLALLLVFAMVAAACGGDDDDASTATDQEPAAEEPAAEEPEEEAPAEEEAPVEEAEGDVDTEVTDEETAGSERAYGGTVSVGLEAEAVGLRPWEDTFASPVYNMASGIYDKLMETDVDGNLQPWLAESISSNEDFTVWTLVLRSGVVFHNGVELTAQTIADMFPLQQVGATGAGQIAASNLAAVDATGDLEVTYTLSQANSAFPAFLERAQLGMVFEPAAAAADIDAFSVSPVGTGPFYVDSRDIDNETVMLRNENYWRTDPDGNQLPYLDSLIFRPIPDEGTRLDALLSGTVSAMQTLRQGTIRDARAEDGIVLNEFQGNNVGGGHFNTLLPPYDDVRVRRGLTHLNDQDSVIEALGGTGISLPGTQFFSPDSPWYSEKVAAAYPPFDFDAGVALLQEYVDDPARSDGKAAGSNIAVELSCPPDPTLIAAMQVIEQVWSATGIVDVTLTNFDQATHINLAVTDEAQAHCWRFSDDNDPSITMGSHLAPPTEEIAEAAGLAGVVSPINWPNWFNGEAFGAAVAATQTDVFEERYALYESIMLIMAEEVPVWYSGHTATAIATHPSVQGINGWHLPSGDVGVGFPNAEGRWGEVWLSE